MTTTRALIYTRISDELKQRDGASLDTQLQACRRYVESQPDWVYLYELEDMETGLSASREGYQQLLELVRRRSIDVVVVWRLDRFGRDDGEAMARYKDLARANVKLVSATEGQQTPFLQKLMFLLANEESRRISDRVRPNMRSRAESGLWQGSTPFGYRMDPARKGHLVIDEEEARIVRGLFDRAAGGHTWNNLSRWASEQGVQRRGGSGFFAPVTVKRILRNPVYMGKVRWNVVNSSKLEVDKPVRRQEDEWVLVDGKHAPIVTDAMWNAAQEAMDARKQPYYGQEERAFLLTGLVRCGVCNLAMNGHIYTSKIWDRPTRAKQWCYGCRQSGHPTKGGKGLEKLVVDAILSFPMKPGALDKARILLAGMRPQGEHVEERDRLQERLARATELLLDGTLSREVYRNQRADIEAQIAVIDSQDSALATWKLETAEAERALEYVMGLLGGLVETIERGTTDQRRAVIAHFVSCVRVHRHAPPEIVWHPWAGRLLKASTYTPQ